MASDVHPKLQALVYDILPLEEGAGKQCSEFAWQHGKHKVLIIIIIIIILVDTY